MKLFYEYLRARKTPVLFFMISAAMLISSCLLYHLPVRAMLYPLALCGAAGMLLVALGFAREKRAHERLSEIKRTGFLREEELPAAEDLLQRDYQSLLAEENTRRIRQENAAEAKYSAMIDYYTVWAHQIKTPIASMKLSLQGEDSAFSRRLQSDLGRVERYVEMVMTYLRLDSSSTDFVFRECDLDGLLRGAIRQFSGDFITKKLRIEYEPARRTVITDEKWLSFVVEQVLSNAVKYTDAGSVSVTFKEPDTICISDTGIGIAASDLPRIFENGFTGLSGRTSRQSSGIGLYLCKRICDKLGCSISAESEPGKGTTVCIRLGVTKL